MKMSLIVILATAFCIASSAAAQDKETQAKSKPCEYTGTVKAKLENPNRITLEIQETLIEFEFTYDGKKECISWENLGVGNNVNVTCKEKKNGMEATCVKPISSGTTLKGVTIKGGSVR